MKTISIDVYQFDELSDEAKQRAREWYREGIGYAFEANFEPAETAARILGITFDTRDIPLMNGKTRQESNILYSGWGCQGDGASFTGSYRYAKGSSKAIRAEFPTDTELHSIADELLALQKRYRYKLAACITQRGLYVHDKTMYIIPVSDYRLPDRTMVSEVLLELMRRFARWIYAGIRNDYYYQMSDESIDDSIMANEYDFTVDGSHRASL